MKDGIKRWITADCAFRVLTARTTDSVTEAARVIDTAPEITGVFGKMLTGTTLFQLAQCPTDRVQCTLYHSGTAGSIMADVWPGPTFRGRVEHPSPSRGPHIGRAGEIHMSRLRLLKGGELFESVVPLDLDKVTDVSGALQQYTLDSEQVLTFYSLSVVMEESRITRAGGMLIQALPEMRHEHLEKMTAALEQAAFEDLVIAGEDPIEATESLLSSLHIQAIGHDPVSYQCRCSKEAAIQAIMTLNEEELDTLKEGGQELVTCAFCGSQYPVTAKDL